MAVTAAGCATTKHRVRRTNFPRAPLEPEIAKLPGAQGYWIPDPVYRGKLCSGG